MARGPVKCTPATVSRVDSAPSACNSAARRLSTPLGHVANHASRVGELTGSTTDLVGVIFSYITDTYKDYFSQLLGRRTLERQAYSLGFRLPVAEVLEPAGRLRAFALALGFALGFALAFGLAFACGSIASFSFNITSSTKSEELSM